MEISELGSSCTFPGGDPDPTPHTVAVHPSRTRFEVLSFLFVNIFGGNAVGPCWPVAVGFSPCLRGFAWLGGGGGGWGRAPSATRALSSSSGSHGDEGGGGSPSPDDHLTPTRSAGGSSVRDRLATARARREPASNGSSVNDRLAAARGKGKPAQGVVVGDPAAGGAARGGRGGRGGYGASPRGGGSGGGGGHSGGGAEVKRKAPFAERASAESLQLNSELSQAGSVEEILTLVDERADVFNAVNVSTALNKLWSGLMDSARHFMGCKLMDGARHVIGCKLSKESSAQNAFDDVASTMHQSLSCGSSRRAGRTGQGGAY